MPPAGCPTGCTEDGTLVGAVPPCQRERYPRLRARRSFLQVALIAGKTQLAEVLIERGAAREDPQALLFMLAESGVSDRDSLQFLIRQGADVNARNAAGATALHVAIANGRLLVVKRLIALGADVNAVDEAGRTPLSIATADW